MTDTEATYDHEATLTNMTNAFRTFAMLSLIVDDAEMEQARRTISTAESIGFIVDPTRYHRAIYSGSLQRQKELVDLFISTRAQLRKLFPEGWPE